MFNVGDRVRVKDGCSDWRIEQRETTILAISGQIAMVFKQGGYAQNHHGVIYESTWSVFFEHLELIGRVVVQPPYTTTCKHCKSPARKISSALFCSNGRCKSRHTFKKSFPVAYVKPSVVKSPLEVLVMCRECNAQIKLITGTNPRQPLTHKYLVECVNDHAYEQTFLDGWKAHHMTLLYVYDAIKGVFRLA
jgi:hypothetical protein